MAKENKFSSESIKKLQECHEDLQTIMLTALQGRDIKIECGYRGQDAQDEAFANGYSKLQYPNSKHNKMPSMAVDVTPYPERYSDAKAQERLGFYIRGIADALYQDGRISHRLRWGGDWDGDFDRKDQTFDDLPHFELLEE